MSSARPSSEPTLSPFETASTWARELEEWGFVRERVLPKLDIRAARVARGLAAELRDANAEVEEGRALQDDVTVGDGLERLARLRREALELIERDIAAHAEAATETMSKSGSRRRAEMMAPVSDKPVAPRTSNG